MDFEYYVEKAFSQNCQLSREFKNGIAHYELKSNVTEASFKTTSLDAISVKLKFDFDFQKREEYDHVPRAF